MITIYCLDRYQINLSVKLSFYINQKNPMNFDTIKKYTLPVIKWYFSIKAKFFHTLDESDLLQRIALIINLILKLSMAIPVIVRHNLESI